MSSRQRRKITVALAGNPNVGKSTLFNALTHSHQHTGNWPGKTVGMALGTRWTGGEDYTFVDLPGTYALDGVTQDEQIAAGYIRDGQADCILVVCDGSCLERNLILALQVIGCGRPTVVCVNLMDEARARGIRVDRDALETELGVPVVLTAAGKKQGLDTLLACLAETAALASEAKTWEDPVSAAGEIARRCVKRSEDSQNWRHRADKLLVSRSLGIPLMVVFLLLVVWLTVWGANYPSRLLEGLFDWLYRLLRPGAYALPFGLGALLLDGVYTTCARVISVMLPPMAIFFPLFTLLEDIGYLPRMAFLLDHGMCRCGGCGKQALTMCMGLGCNAVGVMGCRIIDSPRERLAAILTNAMVPCNGRFPTLIILGSLFFPGVGAAFLVAACVALGMAGAMGACGVLSRTALRGTPSTFVMELPPLRRPRLGQILVRSLVERTLHVAMRAIRVAAPVGALLYLLGAGGLMEPLAALLEPVGRLLGMNGVILLAFVLSLPANELLIPVILMTLTGAASLTGDSAMGNALLLGGMTWQNALCTMVFTVFHWPCSTTLLTVWRETGSIKKTAAAWMMPTAVGCILCIMLALVIG